MAPLDELLGITSSQGKHQLLIAVMLIQTVFGILGALIVGKQIMQLMRKIPKRKVLPVMWRMMIHGHMDDLG